MAAARRAPRSSSSSTTRPTSSATSPRRSPRPSRRSRPELGRRGRTTATRSTTADDAGATDRRPDVDAPRPLTAADRADGMRLLDAELLDSREILPGQWLQTYHAPWLASGSRAGQFVHVRTADCSGLVLRRPFSDQHRRTRPPGTITIHFRITGKGTDWLTRLRPGERLEMLGPLGRPFEVDPRSRHLLLVAGGLGMAGVRPLADEALRGRPPGDAPVRRRVGARRSTRRSLLPDEVEYVVATDDGSLGPPRVRDRARARVRGVGRPGLRLRPAADAGRAGPAGRPGATPGSAWPGSAASAASGEPRPPSGSPAARRKALLQVSMEQNMGCAVGACLGCVVMGVDGPRSASAARARSSPPTRSPGRTPADEGKASGGHQPGRRRPRPRPGRRRRATPTVRARAQPSGAGSRGRRPGADRPRRRRDRGRAAPDRAARSRPTVRPRRTSTWRRPGPRRSSCANPILVASGTFGYGIEYGDVVDVERLGAICCKGTTLKAAHRQPATARDRDAGRDAQLDRPPEPGRRRGHREVRARPGRPGRCRSSSTSPGESVDDYVEVARRLDGVPGVAGIELNISCPNVGKGGLQFALDADAAGAVTAAVRRATDLPLHGQAVAQRRRHPADRPGHRGRRRGRDHAPSTRSRAWPCDRHAPQAAPGQHLRRALRAGDQAGRAARRLRGRPGRATSRSSPSAA